MVIKMTDSEVCSRFYFFYFVMSLVGYGGCLRVATVDFRYLVVA
jgi:hypothetical protein